MSEHTSWPGRRLLTDAVSTHRLFKQCCEMLLNFKQAPFLEAASHCAFGRHGFISQFVFKMLRGYC